MRQPSSPVPDTRLPAGLRVAAALVLAGDLAACALVLAGGSWGGDPASPPFVWRDVAAVHLLCSLPLAAVLADITRRRTSPAGAVTLAAVVLGLSVLPLAGAAGLPDPSLGLVIRAALALGLTAPAALAVAVLAGGSRPRGRLAAAVAVGLVMLLLPPWTFVGARGRHDVARLGEYLEQSRFGEARTLVHGLLALGVEGQWNGHPLPRVAADVDRVVRDLEARAAVPLPDRAGAGPRLDRARQLAMLGRTDEALAVLGSVRDPAAVGDVDGLTATIRESRGEWEAALASYQSARAAWEARPPSPEREAELVRATTGVAYCLRKLGRYAEAEAAYRQVLALAPTADSHFLLAQFYEDAQDAAKARTHARQAMALAPDRYQQDGEKLIRKLAVFHFGCMGVFTAENEPPAAPAPSGAGGELP